jgi:hypothetical protein
MENATNYLRKQAKRRNKTERLAGPTKCHDNITEGAPTNLTFLPSPFPHFTFRQDDPDSLKGSFFLFHPVYISVDSRSLDAVDSSFLLSKHHLTFLWSLNVPTTLLTP